jgi:hypothetical protein
VWGIDSIVKRAREFLFSEVATALFALLPPACVFLNVVEVADARVFMIELAIAAPSIGKIRGIAAYPLLAARGFHQR